VDRPAGRIDADVVLSDSFGGARDGVAHLIAHGHRRIAYIGDYSDVVTSAARLAAYRQALTDHGLGVPEHLVHADCPTVDAAAAAMSTLLAEPEQPTAIFSAATRCSLGVVPTMHRERRTDIALVGFGDFAMADALDPAVSVVDHDGAAIGREAAARLLRRIQEPELPAATIHVPVALLQRGSGELLP
jgi:LacI family transcriptional regulator